MEDEEVNIKAMELYDAASIEKKAPRAGSAD
jgi:hypothetical protein